MIFMYDFYLTIYVVIQFRDLYSTELKHLYNARPLIEHIFDYIDLDKDGKVNFKEILFFKATNISETENNEKLR